MNSPKSPCIAPVQRLWQSQLSPSQSEAPQNPRESPESAETEETRVPPHRPPQGLEGTETPREPWWNRWFGG